MRDFGNRRGGGGFRRSFGPREMHKAVCSECGNECEVPFKPAEGRPVFCRDCYRKKKDESFGGPRDEPRKEEVEEFSESPSEDIAPEEEPADEASEESAPEEESEEKSSEEF